MLLQKSFMGGFLIGITSYMYLIIQNQTLGAFLFSIGLITICSTELKLYTGSVGFQFDKELILILLWNIFGIMIAAFLCTIINSNITSIAREITFQKLTSTYFQIIIKGFFCGICMYYGIYIWKKTKSLIGVIGFVALFILSGFEHCIADLFYFACSRILSIELFLKWILILLGNTLGARFCCEINKEKLL